MTINTSQCLTTRGWMLEMLKSTLSWKFQVISSRTLQSRTFFTTCFSSKDILLSQFYFEVMVCSNLTLACFHI